MGDASYSVWWWLGVIVFILMTTFLILYIILEPLASSFKIVKDSKSESVIRKRIFIYWTLVMINVLIIFSIRASGNVFYVLVSFSIIFFGYRQLIYKKYNLNKHT